MEVRITRTPKIEAADLATRLVELLDRTTTEGDRAGGIPSPLLVMRDGEARGVLLSVADYHALTSLDNAAFRPRGAKRRARPGSGQRFRLSP